MIDNRELKNSERYVVYLGKRGEEDYVDGIFFGEKGGTLMLLVRKNKKPALYSLIHYSIEDNLIRVKYPKETRMSKEEMDFAEQILRSMEI